MLLQGSFGERDPQRASVCPPAGSGIRHNGVVEQLRRWCGSSRLSLGRSRSLGHDARLGVAPDGRLAAAAAQRHCGGHQQQPPQVRCRCEHLELQTQTRYRMRIHTKPSRAEVCPTAQYAMAQGSKTAAPAACSQPQRCAGPCDAGSSDGGHASDSRPPARAPAGSAAGLPAAAAAHLAAATGDAAGRW